ncbi:hypothetical protein pb186bvf_009896 [Paramecium bursaria]
MQKFNHQYEYLKITQILDLNKLLEEVQYFSKFINLNHLMQLDVSKMTFMQFYVPQNLLIKSTSFAYQPYRPLSHLILNPQVTFRILFYLPKYELVYAWNIYKLDWEQIWFSILPYPLFSLGQTSLNKNQISQLFIWYKFLSWDRQIIVIVLSSKFMKVSQFGQQLNQ